MYGFIEKIGFLGHRWGFRAYFLDGKSIRRHTVYGTGKAPTLSLVVVFFVVVAVVVVAFAVVAVVVLILLVVVVESKTAPILVAVAATEGTICTKYE